MRDEIRFLLNGQIQHVSDCAGDVRKVSPDFTQFRVASDFTRC